MSVKEFRGVSFPQSAYVGAGLDPQQLMDLISYIEQDGAKNILEFGSGGSTEFLLSARENLGLNFRLTSFDNSQKWCFKPRGVYSNFELKLRKLVQYTDRQFDEMMAGDGVPTGTYIFPGDSDFRVKNAFYEILHDDLADDYDIIILDGPNGSGRGISFCHLVDTVHPGTKIFIDDYHHYPFLQQAQNLIDFKILKQSNDFEFHPLHGYVILEVR